MSSSYRIELDNFLKEQRVNTHTIFDVGGAQLPVKDRLDECIYSEYKIIDLPDPHKDSQKPDIAFNLEEDHWGKDKPKANVVFCLEVFDYIVLPDVALSNLANMLKPGGIAYVTFPFIYPTHQPLEAEGLRYTENAIRRLAKIAGLRVSYIVPRRPETNLLTSFYSAERMRIAKGYDHDVTGWICEFAK